MDSFYAAQTFPTLINSILLSPFAIIFIPILIRYGSKDKEEANRIISTAANLIFIALLAVSALTFAFAGAVIEYSTPGLDAGTAHDAAKILRILSASVFFAGAASVLTGILNAFEHFLWPALSGTFITLSSIFLILLFADKWGVYVLGWGILAGAVFQFIFLAPFAKKHGFDYHPVIDLKHPEINRSLNSALIYLIIMTLANLSTVVTRFMASWLPAGSIAGLAYADKLVQVPMLIFSGAIASSIYPFLSAQAAENKVEEIRNTVSLSVRMSGFIFIPLTVTIAILAKPAIQLLFQRGAFDPAATELTSAIFVFYSLQLLANYAGTIFMRVLFAFQDFKIILKVISANLALTMILNFIFIKFMRPPACGIALSTSLGSFFSAILYFMILKNRISNLHGAAILRSLSMITACSAVSGLAVFLAYAGMNSVFQGGVLTRAAVLLASSGAGLLVFLATAAFLKLEEFRKVRQLIRTRLGTQPSGAA
jgi:putative peptidoglycan lipid II flippase